MTTTVKIDTKNIAQYITSMDNFLLKWRFTDEKYDKLPEIHLEQLKPLNIKFSNHIWNNLIESEIHGDYPFQKEFFKTADHFKYIEGEESNVKKWLFKRGIPFSFEVYLSWQPDDAMIVSWKIFVKYFDSFYYYGDQLTVFDPNLSWAIIFDEDNIYFGTNKKYEMID
jgi:hypothetical protein